MGDPGLQREHGGAWRGVALLLLGAASCGRGAQDGADRSVEEEPSTETLEDPDVVLAGRVVDERGQPVVGAGVTGICGRDGSEYARVSAQTDGKGEFRIDTLLWGDIRLEAGFPGYRPASRALGAMSAIDAFEDLTLVLADGNALDGRVRWSDGSPASNAYVFISSTVEFRWVRTGSEGGFVTQGLGDGPFRVVALGNPEWGSAYELVTARDVPPGALRLDLTLRRTGHLDVVVTNRPESEDVFSYVLDEEGGTAGWPVSSDLAVYPPIHDLVPGELEPGSYWIDVTDEERGLAAHRRFDIVEGQTTKVEVELGPATRVEVTVLEKGVPLRFPLFYYDLRCADGFRDRAGPRSCVEDSLTRWLPPGAYHLEVGDEGGTAEVEFTVAGEKELQLRLDLE